MKEAAGEANMTVITIVLIGLVLAAGVILIPNLLTSMAKNSCCTSNGGTWQNGKCNGVTNWNSLWDSKNNKCVG